MSVQPDDTLVEQLTSREMDVLKLLAEGMSNQEIASTLVMEVGTVKWYNTQIYGKLQVKNRKQAVTRARTLGIVETQTDDPLQPLQHNLPADPLPFIGRMGEIDELVQQLTGEKYRLITILGPGGMGKTRLAIEVGRRLLGAFVDGVYFIPLAAVTSEETMVTTIAEVVGFKFHSDMQPLQQLLTHLQRQCLLLIVDNFEHLLEHARMLADVLKAACRVKVLVTSREKLGLGGEVVYVIGGLSTPYEAGAEIGAHDAVKLFCEVANRTSSPVGGDDMGVVARICQLLGGMPLGILLAAAWVDTLSLTEIEAEIRTGLDILEATQRDAPQRHQSIQAVFDHSWSRLTAAEQAVFMRLTVFRAGFTREAAQAVTGASMRDLQRLVHTSFIQHLPTGRYAVHELMRQYGERKLVAAGEFETVRERHAQYFAEFIMPVGQEMIWFPASAVLEAAKPDYENVRAAWEFQLERKDIGELRRLLAGLWVFLDSYSRSQEAVDLFEAALDTLQACEGSDVTLFRGQLLAYLGWFYSDIGLNTKGLELLEQGLDILQPSGWIDALLPVYAGLGALLWKEGALQDAMDAWATGLELSPQTDDPKWQPLFCSMIADIYYEMGHFREALQWLDRNPEGMGLMVRGATLTQLGEYARARECLLADFAQEVLCHQYGMVMRYYYLLENAVLAGDRAQAWLYLQRGLHYADDETYAWSALDMLGFALSLFVAEEQFPEAVEVLSLIVHHPQTIERTRAQATKNYEDVLRASLPSDEFAAAWERGQHLDLGDLITDLMER